MTIPQIEIMMSDLPHTLYAKTKDKKENKVVVDDEATRLQEEANKRFQEKVNKQQQYTIEDLFNGAADED